MPKASTLDELTRIHAEEWGDALDEPAVLIRSWAGRPLTWQAERILRLWGLRPAPNTVKRIQSELSQSPTTRSNT